MLKLKNELLLAYAVDFTSFLLERINLDNIKRIILFGSVARGEASDESDIDLFIDVNRDEKTIKKEVYKILVDFIGSLKYGKYWMLKDIKNQIKPMVGRLNDWKELKNSIISNGVILYGRFEEAPENAVHKTLLSWENVKPESKRVLLSKRLFGYKKGKKNYSGLIQKFNEERVGKGIIIVNSYNEKIFLKLFRDMKIKIKIKKVLEYS